MPPDAPTPRVLFDFRDPAAAAAWFAIDDGVMGGRSHSGLMISEKQAGLFRLEIAWIAAVRAT